MPSVRVARIISLAAGLALLSAGTVGAQNATPPPQAFGEQLKTAVVTSALDPTMMNTAVVETALERHTGLGGKTSGKRGAWTPVDPLPTTDNVVQAVQDLAQSNHDVIVISGGDSSATVGIANRFRNTTFLDIGQGQPCVTFDGQFDPSGECAGGDIGIPFNYSSIDFAVEDAAYLAGILAAAASREDRLGIISGTPECEQCNRYIRGFVTGARSIEPGIDVEIAYLADDEINGFGDAASAATFTRAFIDVHQPDVLLPVGRGATSGMIDAACESGEVLVIGAGSDIAAERPELTDCVLTSVTVDIANAVREAMNAFANGTTERTVVYDTVTGGVDIEFPQRATLPVDTAERFEEARSSILTGQVETCPGDCGAPLDLDAASAAAEVTE